MNGSVSFVDQGNALFINVQVMKMPKDYSKFKIQINQISLNE